MQEPTKQSKELLYTIQEIIDEHLFDININQTNDNVPSLILLDLVNHVSSFYDVLRLYLSELNDAIKNQDIYIEGEFVFVNTEYLYDKFKPFFYYQFPINYVLR